MIPIDLRLSTSQVLLRPMEENDYEPFLALAQDEDAWHYFTLDLSDTGQLKQWMDTAMEERKKGIRRPFTIIDRANESIAGSMSIGNISMHDSRAEIGWSWLGKDYRGLDINRQSKYAMMRYCFEDLNF